jgi:uncharacterized OB-fold protein
MEKEPLVFDEPYVADYEYSVGKTGTRFFTELKENRKILGTRCPSCDLVYFPPRSICGTCLSKLNEWKELGHKGTLITYTVVRYPSAAHSADPPFAYGIVKLDGADTCISHLLGDLDLENIRIGMRVEAVFEQNRNGNMLDIKYFRPAT